MAFFPLKSFFRFYLRPAVYRPFTDFTKYPPDFPAPHRASNPSIQLSIRLSRANGFHEVLEILNNSNVNMNHRSFGLRIISRHLKHHKSNFDWQRDPRLLALIRKVEQEIEKLGIQEVCDLSFFMRVCCEIHNYNLFPKTSETRYIERVLDLLSQSAFTTRQLISVSYDLSMLGRSSYKIDEALIKVLKNKNDVINIDEIRQIMRVAT